MTTPAAQPSTEFSVFLPFSKVDAQPDGTVMVHSRINDETADDQGEIVTFEAVEKASGPYLEWSNVREMHQADTAAGTMVSLTPIPAERAHEAILHVVDPVAVQKILTKVYKGTSLGGFKTRIQLAKVDGVTQRRVTGIDWRETSLVDRPSRPTAQLTLLKRSDGGDPPELIEEVEVDPTELAKGTVTPAPDAQEGVTTPPVASASALAPEAGQDGYTGADGQPLAKVAETPAAAPDADPAAITTTTAAAAVATPDVPRGTPLAKSAADDVVDAHIIIESINRLIEAEAGESAQVAELQAALAAMQRFETAENTEVGTPEDQAEAEAEEPIHVVVDAVMTYASKGGDLAKLSGALTEALAKASTPAPTAAPATPEPVTVDVDELLAKTTQLIDDRFARYASKPDLDAMKAEVLEAMKPISEGLAKIARQPAPGGPARYAIDTSRLEGESTGPSTEAEVLRKAADSASDPYLREQLGRLAAAAAITAQRTSA